MGKVLTDCMSLSCYGTISTTVKFVRKFGSPGFYSLGRETREGWKNYGNLQLHHATSQKWYKPALKLL